MEGKKNKRVIILAAIVVVLCVVGICYYFLGLSSSSIAGSKKKKIPNGTVYAEYKNNEIPKDKIKSIKNADKILAVLDNSNMLIGIDNAVKNYDPKTGKRNAVNYLNTGLNVEAVCVKYSLLSFIKIIDNKIIYAAIDEKTLTTEYKSFDINTGAKSTLYVDKISNSDEKYTISFPMTFDADLKKGYILVNINNYDVKDKTSTYNLVLLDINKKSKKVLAKSSDDFSTSIDYPNIAFSLDKNIRVYNIEKNKDDFTI